MQFLKTLFWVAFAVVVVLFSSNNWRAVQVDLWGGLQADVKLPVLVFGAFLVGFLPTLILYRARLWSLRRRLETQERNAAMALPIPPAAPTGAARGLTDSPDQRLGSQSTVAPAP
jgi:uncharacterized integral membrane protein